MNLYYKKTKTIKRNVSRRSGTFVRLLFTPISNIDTTIDVFTASHITAEATDEITLKEGAKWYEAFLPPTQRGYEEEQIEDKAAGDFMNIVARGIIPFNDKDVHQQMDYNKYDRFVVLVEFSNGVIYIIGHPDDGAKLKHTEQSGDNFKETPITKLRFTWTTKDKALVYSFPMPDPEL